MARPCHLIGWEEADGLLAPKPSWGGQLRRPGAGRLSPRGSGSAKGCSRHQPGGQRVSTTWRGGFTLVLVPASDQGTRWGGGQRGEGELHCSASARPGLGPSQALRNASKSPEILRAGSAAGPGSASAKRDSPGSSLSADELTGSPLESRAGRLPPPTTEGCSGSLQSARMLGPGREPRGPLQQSRARVNYCLSAASAPRFLFDPLGQFTGGGLGTYCMNFGRVMSFLWLFPAFQKGLLGIPRLTHSLAQG